MDGKAQEKLIKYICKFLNNASEGSMFADSDEQYTRLLAKFKKEIGDDESGVIMIDIFPWLVEELSKEYDIDSEELLKEHEIQKAESEANKLKKIIEGYYKLACNDDVIEFYFQRNPFGYEMRRMLITSCIEKGDESRTKRLMRLLAKDPYTSSYYYRKNKEVMDRIYAKYLDESIIKDEHAFAYSIYMDNLKFFGETEHSHMMCYAHFSSDKVDDNNFKTLYENLLAIEDDYDIKKIDDKESVSYIESIMTFEQGKYLENVKWSGEKFEFCPSINFDQFIYSKMNYMQLKYYLFWRTEFIHNRFIPTNNVFYYLLVQELIADFNLSNENTNLELLERLYMHVGENELSHIEWVLDYAECHDKRICNGRIREQVRQFYNSITYEYEDIRKNQFLNGDYAGAFDLLYSISRYKFKNTKLGHNEECINIVKNVLELTLPKLKELFENNSLKLETYLLGAPHRNISRRKYYNDIYWNLVVLKRNGVPCEGKYNDEYNSRVKEIYITDIEGNIIRKTAALTDRCDPNLASFIFQYLVSRVSDITSIGGVKPPSKPRGGIQMKFATGYEYIISANSQAYEEDKRYLELYNQDIPNTIQCVFDDYILHNPDIITSILKSKSEKRTKNKEKLSVKEKPIVNPRLEMFNFINSTIQDEFSIESIKNILDYYNGFTNKQKLLINDNIFFILWNLWICIPNSISYEEYEECVGIKHYLKEKKAIIQHRYEVSIPYFLYINDVYNGVVSRVIRKELILDCIVLCFKMIDAMFSMHKINITDFILGKWTTLQWNPLSDGLNIQNRRLIDIKNFDGVEIYTYNQSNNLGTIERHSCDENACKFVDCVIKYIDNALRTYCKKIKPIKQNVDIVEIYKDNPEYGEIAKIIPEIVSDIVRRVITLDIGKLKLEAIDDPEKIVISHSYSKQKNELVAIAKMDIDNMLDQIFDDYYKIK